MSCHHKTENPANVAIFRCSLTCWVSKSILFLGFPENAMFPMAQFSCLPPLLLFIFYLHLLQADQLQWTNVHYPKFASSTTIYIIQYLFVSSSPSTPTPRHRWDMRLFFAMDAALSFPHSHNSLLLIHPLTGILKNNLFDLILSLDKAYNFIWKCFSTTPWAASPHWRCCTVLSCCHLLMNTSCHFFLLLWINWNERNVSIGTQTLKAGKNLQGQFLITALTWNIVLFTSQLKPSSTMHCCRGIKISMNIEVFIY